MGEICKKTNIEHKKKNGKTLAVKPFLSGCGSRIWTDDLRVMSPTSYRAALSRDIYCLYLYSYIIIHLVIRFVKPFYNIFLKNQKYICKP